MQYGQVHRCHVSGAQAARQARRSVALLVAALTWLVGTSVPAWAGRVPRVPVPAPALGPPPGTHALLQVLAADEGQLESLAAYGDAQSYLREALAHLKSARRALSRAQAIWREAQRQERSAVRAEAAAAATVNLYQQALSELGIAEYTDQAALSGTGLPAQERVVNEVQLGDVAASDTSAALSGALADLARAKRRVVATRLEVRQTWASTVRAHSVLVRARAQLTASRHALVDAREWAAVAGQAPAQPVQALVQMEGTLAAPHEPLHPGYGSRPTTSRPTTSRPTTSRPQSPAGPTVMSRARPGHGALEAGAMQAVQPGTGEPGTGQLSPDGPSILGPSVLSASQIEAWFASTGVQAQTTVPMGELIADYMAAGRITGVRADVAFAQSVVETGYFSFPAGGQDPSSYNNFAGIGACGSCKHGWSFPTAMAGVLGQMELLRSYASAPGALAGPVPGPGGCCQTWMSLSGTWATNPAYGYEILSIYQQMLALAVQSDIQRTDLAAGTPQGPSTSAQHPPDLGPPELGPPDLGPPTLGPPALVTSP